MQFDIKLWLELVILQLEELQQAILVSKAKIGLIFRIKCHSLHHGGNYHRSLLGALVVLKHVVNHAFVPVGN